MTEVRNASQGWVYSPMVEHLSSETLGSVVQKEKKDGA